jgi:hypothetical protein
MGTRTCVTLLLALASTSCGVAPPAEPTSLVGSDLAAVREFLGPPIRVSAGGGVLRLSYLNDQREVLKSAVVVVEVRTTPGDLQTELSLAPVSEAVRRLGPTREVLTGSRSVTAKFDGWTATICDGVVVGLQKS